MNPVVRFYPSQKIITVPLGTTVKAAMEQAGMVGDFPCGGIGRCRKCRIQVLKGAAQPTDAEKEVLGGAELVSGVRLACITRVNEDVNVQSPDAAQNHKILTQSEMPVEIDPHLRKIVFSNPSPGKAPHRSDWQYLEEQINQQCPEMADFSLSVPLLRRFPEKLRNAAQHSAALLFDNQLIDIKPDTNATTIFGMAIDIGTTTIVGYLLDLTSGEVRCVVSQLNPQTSYGADIISRIHFVRDTSDGLSMLHQALTKAVNLMIRHAVNSAQIKTDDIYLVSVVANTCMHHLFIGISPRYLATPPYRPAIHAPLVGDAWEMGIDVNPAGKILMLPIIAGYIGSDTTAAILAAKLDRSEHINLIVDIGTNGEVVLGSSKLMMACSTAAGPAFEGAQIRCGMRGQEGAIDHVYLNRRLEFTMIGGGRPVGICGSALLDLVATLLEAGVITARGKILAPEMVDVDLDWDYADHYIQIDNEPAISLLEADRTGHGQPIVITQDDIRQFQVAKGAIAAGIHVLVHALAIEMDDIERVLVAGAFGNYLNPHNACVTGLIPQQLEERIEMMGNAAGTGSKIALLSSREFHRASRIAQSTITVDLNSYPDFNRIFAKCTYLTTFQ